MAVNDSFIEVAKVIKPQGLKGELKLLTYSQDPRDLLRYKTFYLGGENQPYAKYEVAYFRFMPPYAIMKLAEINNREQAEDFRNYRIAISPEQLCPTNRGEYFIRDLLGLQVISDQGARLGTLTDVLELPAHDVYQVTDDRRELLLPAIPQVILEVKLEAGIMVVHLLEGLLDFQ